MKKIIFILPFIFWLCVLCSATKPPVTPNTVQEDKRAEIRIQVEGVKNLMDIMLNMIDNLENVNARILKIPLPDGSAIKDTLQLSAQKKTIISTQFDAAVDSAIVKLREIKKIKDKTK